MSINKLPECIQWLADFMRSHPIVECRTVRGEAYKKGFSQRELREAKKDFRINHRVHLQREGTKSLAMEVRICLKRN